MPERTASKKPTETQLRDSGAETSSGYSRPPQIGPGRGRDLQENSSRTQELAGTVPLPGPSPDAWTPTGSSIYTGRLAWDSPPHPPPFSSRLVSPNLPHSAGSPPRWLQFPSGSNTQGPATMISCGPAPSDSPPDRSPPEQRLPRLTPQASPQGPAPRQRDKGQRDSCQGERGRSPHIPCQRQPRQWAPPSNKSLVGAPERESPGIQLRQPQQSKRGQLSGPTAGPAPVKAP